MRSGRSRLRGVAADAIVARMATGLDSFDSFSWASLLAGRQVLLCDGVRERGLKTADALEEAGARATLAPGQAIAADRLATGDFALLVLVPASGESVSAPLKTALERKRTAVLIVAPAERHRQLREDFPAARLATPGIGGRDLVMLVTGTADE